MVRTKYTRSEAGRRSYLAATGIELPGTILHAEIKARVRVLPIDVQRRCQRLYRQYMAVGRPEYLKNLRQNQADNY